jgi:hypothetical protein
LVSSLPAASPEAASFAATTANMAHRGRFLAASRAICHADMLAFRLAPRRPEALLGFPEDRPPAKGLARTD